MQQLETQYAHSEAKQHMLQILQRLHDTEAAELAEAGAQNSESDDEQAQAQADPELSTQLLEKLSLSVSCPAG